MSKETKTAYTEPELRFERKSVNSSSSESDLILKIKQHPLMFREIFHPRQINSIYYDSVFYKHYRENVEGLPYRRKLRIRWYGEKFGLIDKPILEVKEKKSLVGTKQRARIGQFEFGLKPCTSFIQQQVAESDALREVKEYFSYLRPTIFCSYKRRYFLSADKFYRLTLDTKIQYYTLTPDGVPHFNSKEKRSVIEVK